MPPGKQTDFLDVATAEESTKPLDMALFCLLAGVVSTFARGYGFGVPGQLAQLLRELDPDYLAGDFFVNANTSVIGVRFYYVKFLAVLAAWVPLPALFLGLTILANTVMAAVTCWVSGKIWQGSRLAAILATTLVLCVDSVTLGNATWLADPALVPALLIRPLALMSLWLAINRRVFWCVILAAVAIPIHPLVGFETAAIGLAAAGLSSIFPAPGTASENWPARLRQLTIVVGATGVLYGLVHCLFSSGLEKTISTEQFIHILAEVRAPHHYLPSMFGIREYVVFGFFLLAQWMSWRWWKREETTDPAIARAVLAVNVVVLLALVCGYLFVEIIPTRIWVSAQTFRMIYIVKWWGFILFGGTIAGLVRRSSSLDESIAGWCMLMGTGLFQPLVVLLGHVWHGSRRHVLSRCGRFVTQIVPGLALVGIVSLATVGEPSEAQAVVLLAGMGFWFLLTPSRWAYRMVPVAVVGLGLLVMAWGQLRGISIPRMPRPEFTFSDSTHPGVATATWAAKNTPDDAVFMVPPDFGFFRTLARRAIVVDYEGFFVIDANMLIWYERMTDCYGAFAHGRLTSHTDFAGNYAALDDDRIVKIGKKYGARYAVLFRRTNSRLPLVYEDASYKVVRIEADGTQ